MLGDKGLFEDMSRVASGAASALGGIRARLEGDIRDHLERLLQRMNLVSREEFDIVSAVAAKAREEQEILTERLAALEARLARASAPRKAAPVPSGRRRNTAEPLKPKAGRPRRPRDKS